MKKRIPKMPRRASSLESSYSDENVQFWNISLIADDHRFFKAAATGDLASVVNIIDRWEEREDEDRNDYNDPRFDDWDPDGHEYPQKYPDASALDSKGNTALHLAAKGGFPLVVVLLNSKGARVNKANKKGETALLLAVMGNHVDTVEALLSLKASVAVGVKSSGDTAPHIAARNGNLRIVKLLVDKKADLKAKNKASQTPVDCVLADCADAAEIRAILGGKNTCRQETEEAADGEPKVKKGRRVEKK